MASLAVLALTVTLSLCRALEGDVVWYIDSTSSADVATCGHDPAEPCSSFEVVFAQSPLVNASSNCYQSMGDSDGRNSTTVFLSGSMFVPAVCLYNWRNLRISSHPPGSQVVINTNRFGSNSVFSFTNCSNLTLEGLLFNTSSQGRQNLYIQDSTDVTLRRCSMPLTATNGYGVEFRGCGGDILVDESQFYGDPSVNGGDNRGIALRLVTGSESFFSDQVFPAMNVLVRGCEFRNLVSYGTPEDSYRQALSSALSMLVQLRWGAYNNRLTVEDSRFHNITNSVGHSVTVHFDSGSINNSVVFSRCLFTGNTVRYGGGVAIYFSGSSPGSLNGSLEVSDCNFTDNVADFEGGGLFFAYLQEDIANQVSIRRCNFQGNQALYGAAVFFFNNPAWYTRTGPPDAVALPLTPANIDDCVFQGNNASLEEGVVNALRMVLGISNGIFTANNGSALLLRLSLAYLEGTLLFEGNLAHKGGAIRVLDRSRIDLQRVDKVVFRRNMAVVSGGAVFGDESSTSFTADEYNHSLAENRFGFCFASFGNEGNPVGNVADNPGRVLFEDNFAFGDGLTMSAYSLRGCQVANFVPKQIADFLLVPTDGTNQFNDSRVLGTTSTGPSYLFFYGASTHCYKPVGNITYLLPNCSHSLLMDTFYTHPDLQCGLDSQLSDLARHYGPGAALKPTVDKLITPWAGIETSWTVELGTRRMQCAEMGKESVPGDLHLAPAPGEQFDLTVQLADQLLNYVSSTIYLEVEHASVTTPPGVLIQLNGIQYSFNDRVFFTPNRALSEVALVGLPGTEGRLRIVADSQIIGQSIVLLIPFKLAQCPIGFYPPSGVSTVEEVNNLLMTDFRETQRIPDTQPLACNCLNETGPGNTKPHFNTRALDIAHTCIRGYTVELNSILWAGLIPAGDSAPLYPDTISCPEVSPDDQPISDSLTEFIMEARMNDSSDSLTSDPVDVVLYEGGVHPGGRAPIMCFPGNNISQLVNYRPDGEFAVEFCTRGYCRGDVLDSWFLSDVDYPCMSDREGLLCGECRSGYALTTYSTICHDCSGAIPAVPILLTLFLGLGLVVAVVAFNFEASPTVDSLLFFTQAVYILLAGRANYDAFQYLAILNPDFTFNLCITSNLNALGRLGLQYVTPFYILFLLLFVLLLTRIKVKFLSKLLGKHSFVKSLWFLILISYLNIAHTTFELLHCRRIGPSDGDQRLVLEHDASITCYEGAHLPAAIIAIFMAVILVLPFPIYVAVLLHFPRFKPFTDVYTFMYRDHRRLWVAWSLARRLLLVLLGVFVTDFAYRHFSLLLGMVLIMVVDVATWPYQFFTDNHFAFLVSWVLIVVAVLTQPDLYLYVDPSRAPSGTLVLAIIVLGVVLAVVERVLRRRKQTVDDVAKKTVAKCLGWGQVVKEKSAGLLIPGRRGKKELPESPVGSIDVIIPTTTELPRYRESLLEDLHSPAAAINTSTASDQATGRKKGWKKRQKEELHTSLQSSPTSGTVVSTVVEQERHSDWGFANVTSEYNSEPL